MIIGSKWRFSIPGWTSNYVTMQFYGQRWAETIQMVVDGIIRMYYVWYVFQKSTTYIYIFSQTEPTGWDIYTHQQKRSWLFVVIFQLHHTVIEEVPIKMIETITITPTDGNDSNNSFNKQAYNDKVNTFA